MRFNDALSIKDLRDMARRRLPRMLFSIIASGAEDDLGVERNRAAFSAWRLQPRRLVDVARIDRAARLFGRPYAAPVGIAPTGFAGFMRRGADLMLARAARAANVPFIASGASVASVEQIAEASDGQAWFQLYTSPDRSLCADMMNRAAGAGVEVLVLTSDTPVLPRRETDRRNGFSIPLRMTPQVLLDGVRHPGWAIDYLRNGGMPSLGNWAKYAPAGSGAAEVAAFFRRHSPHAFTWDDLAWFREAWKGRLVLKGVQSAQDATRAAALGVDGVMVSNHGGKALDALPASLDALPPIAAALGGRIPILFDGGVMRGSEVAIALALGADSVFVGRATLYGVAAAGEPGVRRALDMIIDELEVTLGLIGCPRITDLDATVLTRAGPGPGTEYP